MTPVAGVLLAGGLARRMGGGDKCLRPLAGETLLARVIARVAPQVDPLILNANGDPARFARYDLPVVADVVEGHAGPLAGILTALEWAAEHAPHHPLVRASPQMRPSYRVIWFRRWVEARDLAGADLAAPPRAGGASGVRGSGRWSSAPTCAPPWWSRASARSTAGRKSQAGGGSPSPALPWTRSSTPTARTTWPRPSA